ncbi:MAG: hypothetical protein LR015_10115 [Verrucomicrobia bacterium]|nr:hypothetical protein [Verrucomicrobiota bacterium]
MNPIITEPSPGTRLWRERPDQRISEHCGQAWCAQAVQSPPHSIGDNGDWCWEFELEAGAEVSLDFAMVMGETSAVAEHATQLVKTVAEQLSTIEAQWRDLWRQVFAGGPEFSGSLPDLELPEALAPVAVSAIFTALYLRRKHSPNKGLTRYSISMPRRVEACFYPNDWALAAGILARLDPEPTWQQLEMALSADIRKFNQINTLTGKGGDYSGHGWPYAMDIFNCFLVGLKLVQQGGTDWLKRTIRTASGTMSLLAALEDLAFDYRKNLIPELGLADYGARQQLLECVSTYEHAVASLNAGAVWMLRELASLYRTLGRTEDASALVAESNKLQQAILDQLYVEGKGWFRSVAPDGSARECRHCWDTGMVLW